jgi:hypothetical protein
MIRIIYILIFITNLNNLNCSEVNQTNCRKCNDQICVYDLINNTITFNHCICGYPLCDDRCSSILIPIEKIRHCYSQGIFCSNNYIQKRTIKFMANFGLICFIFMIVSGAIGMIISVAGLCCNYLLNQAMGNYRDLGNVTDMANNEIQHRSILKCSIGIKTYICTSFVMFSLSLAGFLTCHLKIINKSIDYTNDPCM